MAEFQKVAYDAKRMCNTYFVGCCEECPLDELGCSMQSESFQADKFEEIIENWAADHPVKTNRMVLKEMFPNASFTNFHPCCLDHTVYEKCSKTICWECSSKWLDGEYKGGADSGKPND